MKFEFHERQPLRGTRCDVQKPLLVLRFNLLSAELGGFITNCDTARMKWSECGCEWRYKKKDGNYWVALSGLFKPSPWERRWDLCLSCTNQTRHMFCCAPRTLLCHTIHTRWGRRTAQIHFTPCSCCAVLSLFNLLIFSARCCFFVVNRTDKRLPSAFSRGAEEGYSFVSKKIHMAV